VEVESLSHAQGTHEHVKEMQQTRPDSTNPASRADVVDATRSGFIPVIPAESKLNLTE